MEYEIPKILYVIARFGLSMGMGYIFMFPVMLFDLIYETAMEKRSKRKTLLGKLSVRECMLIEDRFNECKENFTNENLKKLGDYTFCFLSAQKIIQDERKTFFDKLIFGKKEK